MQRDTLLYGVGLALAVAAGVGLGRAQGHPGDPPHVFTGLGLVSLALLVAGAVSAARAESSRLGRRVGTVLSALAAVSCAVVMVAEPFLEPPWEPAGVWAVAGWVAPFVVAGTVLARVRCWWGAAGAGVFVFACVWLVALNTHMLDHSGFTTRVRR